MSDKRVQIPRKEKEVLISEAHRIANDKLEKMKSRFGKRFSELVKDKKQNENMQQEIIAAHLKITPQTLDNYCKGKSLPQAEQLFLIKELFDVSYDYLLSDTPTENINEDGNLVQLGLSRTALKNFKKMCDEQEEWGFDDRRFVVNPKIFAINKLLEEENDLLFQLGDYLLFPSIEDDKSKEDLYTTLYQYKIMNALDKFITNFRNSKEGKKVSEDRSLKVIEIIDKIDGFQNYTDFIYKK